MKKFQCSVAPLALLAFALPATAQSDDPVNRLDTIVTTAPPSATPLTDIPMSVSVIDTRDLSLADAYVSAEDMTDLLTGVEAAVANGTQVAFHSRHRRG